MDKMEHRQATVIRHADLQPLTKHPADVRLPRYQRERYSVVGRPAERAPGAPGADAAVDVNFGYIKCGPGKGNCSHHHANWEIFIPLSGRWRLTVEGGELDPGRHSLELGPMDMIVLPPDTFHEATNISDGDAWMMSLNPGTKGAGYTIHPEVIADLKRWSEEAGAAASQGVDI